VLSSALLMFRHFVRAFRYAIGEKEFLPVVSGALRRCAPLNPSIVA